MVLFAGLETVTAAAAATTRWFIACILRIYNNTVSCWWRAKCRIAAKCRIDFYNYITVVKWCVVASLGRQCATLVRGAGHAPTRRRSTGRRSRRAAGHHRGVVRVAAESRRRAARRAGPQQSMRDNVRPARGRNDGPEMWRRRRWCRCCHRWSRWRRRRRPHVVQPWPRWHRGHHQTP